MPRDVFLLLGFPGTGKYTVAKAVVAELETRGVTTRLIDSHYVNNPIFGLVHKDGSTPLDHRVWERIHEVREAVLQTIEELSPPDWTFVFTNFITQREVDEEAIPGAYIQRLQDLATSGGGRFHLIRLTCEWEELATRVGRPDRRERMKMLDSARLRDMVDAEVIYDPGGALTLDVTNLQPGLAALRILEHIAN